MEFRVRVFMIIMFKCEGQYCYGIHQNPKTNKKTKNLL